MSQQNIENTNLNNTENTTKSTTKNQLIQAIKKICGELDPNNPLEKMSVKELQDELEEWEKIEELVKEYENDHIEANKSYGPTLEPVRSSNGKILWVYEDTEDWHLHDD